MIIPSNEKLITLMEYFQVDIPVVAELLGRTPGTIRVWRCRSGADIPEQTYFLLYDKLQARSIRYEEPPVVTGREVSIPRPDKDKCDQFLVIRCPYCSEDHRHSVRYGLTASGCTNTHPDSHLGYMIVAETGTETAA